jgi:hypothetical protein
MSPERNGLTNANLTARRGATRLRGVRRTSLTLLGVLTLALFAAASTPARPDTASSSRKVVPFITVSAGASTRHPRRNRVFLGRSLAATKGWWRWLSPGARTALRGLNFDRYGVVVAFRLQKRTGLKITRIARISHTLGLWLAVPKSPPPDPTTVTVGAYHLVAIERSYLSSVSRLVVLAVTVK